MIDVMSVLDCFVLLSGVGQEERASCLPLCSAAAAELGSRVVRGEGQYQSALVFAAAALAAYRYRLLCAAKNDVAVFKAGDVSVSVGGEASAQAARKIYETALADIAPILRDDGFVFRTTV